MIHKNINLKIVECINKIGKNKILKNNELVVNDSFKTILMK